MTGLTITERPRAGDEFFFAFQYDSSKYGLPIPFDGFQLFLNNDQKPFVTLTIDQKKIWNEKVDLKKYLPPGTYTLRLRTFVWSGPGNNTSATIVLKVGQYMDARIYPGPNPPPKPPNPFPEWDAYEKYRSESDSHNFGEEHWDQWTVDYGV